MIGALTPSLPAPGIQTLEQDLSGETLHSWEASSFNGLFESHLSEASEHAVSHQKGGSDETAEVPFHFLEDTSGSAQRASPETVEETIDPQPAGQGDAIGLAIDGGEEWHGWGVDSAAPLTSGTGAMTEELEPGEGADGVRGFVEQQKATAEMRLTLAAGDDGVAEVYVRAPGLDTASALVLAQASARLLADHQMTLGRFKVNGRLPGSADPAETTEAAS